MNLMYYNPARGRFLSQDTHSGNPYDPSDAAPICILREQSDEHDRSDGAQIDYC